MTLPEIDMDRAVMAVITVGVMFASMRLIYGYWPWQLHPTLRRQRAKMGAEPVKVHFEPLAQSTAQDTSDDHFERPATGGEPAITTPPRGPTRTEEHT